ncbi:glycosyltransferase [Kosmotoga sp. DU53]|uniref:glycosyltransferase n=1 Tax=Kosmotoga sp. DU53 TaxID=1310160 RepID=UPI0007C49701|nr:glycosyltransferase [Kosmotoga sp. DU53]MDK2953939.1 sucrose-phosphate synthase [Kosmotoga sp.]OAA21427.1 sucrose-phosphate synthase [Kosmotoga sp. DU53]
MKIAFLNPQGNFDSLDSHWTDHPDFGGQLVYVKELAIAMASLGIDVDIITRRIEDKEWPEFSEPFDFYPGVEGVRIVRIDFGGKKFLSKEKLWPYLKDYVDGIERLYNREKRFPEFVTSHYGDGGMSAAILSLKRKIPFSFTAHSLGAQKMDKLGVTPENFPQFDRVYNFSYRIQAERVSMRYSAVNFVSTTIERFEQYSHELYKGWIDVNDDTKFVVAPPGVNTKIFNPYPNDIDIAIENRLSNVIKIYAPERFDKPFIVSSSRMDQKKNITGLLRAYLSSKKLMDATNLLIVTRGIYDVYKEYPRLSGESGETLRELVELVRQHNAQNRVFFINITSQKELAALYRLVSRKEGIFALTSLYEPFGLAPLEAMACGLPVVATKNGGPSEFLKRGREELGVLVDPEDIFSIIKGLERLMLNPEYRRELSSKVSDYVENYYTWLATAKKYLKTIEERLKIEPLIPAIPEFFLKGGKPEPLF